MSNNIKCGKCVHYNEQRKPLKKGGTKSLHRGHCLIHTVYAKNRPGKNVYPPSAKLEELPFGRHKIELVSEEELRPHCGYAKEA